MAKFETIALNPETKEKLNQLGKKGQTYDEILSTLIQKLEEKNE